jgi:hypothetical protein
VSAGGWFDAEAIADERMDADMEMASLEAAGRRASRGRKRMVALRAAGDLDGAAKACRHGGGYPLDSLAARNAADPRAGEPGVRCLDCGSVLSAWPWDGGTVTAPCEIGGAS